MMGTEGENERRAGCQPERPRRVRSQLTHIPASTYTHTHRKTPRQVSDTSTSRDDK